MTIVLVSSFTSIPFATRLGSALNVPLASIERHDFPDGEHYLRFDIGDRLGLLGKHVVLVAATESGVSIDEVYRLGCSAVVARRLQRHALSALGKLMQISPDGHIMAYLRPKA